MILFVTDISEVITTTIDTTIDGSDTTITTTVDTTYEYIQVIDKIDTTFQGEDTYFVFEGYNVYQHETESGSGATKGIATFDLNNGIKKFLMFLTPTSEKQLIEQCNMDLTQVYEGH